jgi:hypothetical protein
MEADKNLIGIFWHDDIKLLLWNIEELEKGEKYGDFINPVLDHSAYFDKLTKSRIYEIFDKIVREYFNVPRGRVIYDIPGRRYKVFHGNKFNGRIKAEVIKIFNLENKNVFFGKDEHYFLK